MAAAFFPRVIGLAADDVLWTDDSSLDDFRLVDDWDALYARIEAVYGVNVRDLRDASLVELLERLRWTPPRDLPPPSWADEEVNGRDP